MKRWRKHIICLLLVTLPMSLWATVAAPHDCGKPAPAEQQQGTGEHAHHAMQMVEKAGKGLILYMNQEGRGIGLLNKLKAYKLQDEGSDTVEANTKLGFKADERDYMVGLQILKDLGLTNVRLLTNNPKKTNSAIYNGVDLNIVEQVPIIAPHDKHRERYLATKRDKLGHLLPRVENGD